MSSLCVIFWYTNMSDWRLTNILELQNHSFPSLFLRWSLTAQIPKGSEHYWLTLVKFPQCILTLGYVCSKLLDTRWGVCHCVIWPPLLTLQENRNLKAFTQHVLWLLCPVVDPEMIGTSWGRQVVAGSWSDFFIWQSPCLLIVLLIWQNVLVLDLFWQHFVP